MSKSPALSEMLTVNEVAAERGIYPQSVRRAIAQGRLRATRIATILLVSRADLDAYAPRQPGRPRKS